MKIISLIYVLIFFSFENTERVSAIKSRKDLLTNGSRQSWSLHSITPEGQCGSTTDNTWIFLINGTFEFDYGAITDDEVKGCGDFVNITGTWEFTDNETRLKVIASHEKENSSNALNFTMLDGNIEELNDEKLVVISRHPSTNSHYIFEFRKN